MELQLLFLLFDWRTWLVLIIIIISIMVYSSRDKYDKCDLSVYKDRKEWYRESYLHSNHWRKVRNRALASASFKCTMCGSNKRLQVHHLTYKNLGHEKKSDLMVLCRDCHSFQHSKRKHV